MRLRVVVLLAAGLLGLSWGAVRLAGASERDPRLAWLPFGERTLAAETATIQLELGPVVTAQMAFATPATTRVAHGFAFGRPVGVNVDAGNPNATLHVTLTLQANPNTPGATLRCAGDEDPNTEGVQGTAAGGFVAFTGCVIDHWARGFALQASAPGGVVTASQPIHVIGAGDANGDCRVDIEDFSVLLLGFGKTTDLRADFDGEGNVDITDFSILLTRFNSSYAACS